MGKGITFENNKNAYKEIEEFEKQLGRKLTASERAAFIESREHAKSEEYQKLLDHIRERLYKAGITNVNAIMSHVDDSLRHWGIDWRLREAFK